MLVMLPRLEFTQFLSLCPYSSMTSITLIPNIPYLITNL
jgi:hypothetical protein